VCFALLIRARRRGRDIVGWIDAGIVTVNPGLLAWVVLAGPIVSSGDGTAISRAVGLAYPAGDVLLLAMVVRLVIGAGARTVAFRLLVAAGVLLYVADTTFSVLSAASAYEGGAVDPLWLAAYVAWGAAALHPSMRSLSERGNEPRTLTVHRLLLLTVAVLIAPCTLIVQLVLRVPLAAWPVAVCSIAAFVLVVARMSLAGRAVQTSTAQRGRLRDDLTHQAAYDSLTREMAAFSAGSPKASQPIGCSTLKPRCTQYRAITSPSAYASACPMCRSPEGYGNMSSTYLRGRRSAGSPL
jgi:hypothetical protein